MKRALLTQMKNEWASNLWLVVELLIVSLIIAYLCWMLGNKIYVYSLPQPFDRNDVYVGSIRCMPADNEQFVDMGEDTGQRNVEDLFALAGRLRELNCVEAVSLSGNGLPYNYNYQGNQLMDQTLGDSIMMGVNSRFVTSDYPLVMRLQALDNATPQRLSEILSKGEVLLGMSEYYQFGRPQDTLTTTHNALDAKGHTWANNYGMEVVVGDLIPNIRRSDFEHQAAGGTLLIPVDINGNVDRLTEVEVRVRPGRGEEFMEAMYKDPALRSLRNVSFQSFQSLDTIRQMAQDSEVRDIRMKIAQICFLLFIVFLGLLGTFWFRVQERRGEIALRKVCGATNSQVARRLLGEGVLLMSVALILAAGLGIWIFNHFKDDTFSWYLSYHDAYSVLWCSVAAAALLMYLLVTIGIWFPMRRAIRIEPAIALKQE